MPPMWRFKVSPAGYAILESVYQNSPWPIKPEVKTALVARVSQNRRYIDKWFSDRHEKDRGITWDIQEEPLNIEPLNVVPAPPPQQELPQGHEQDNLVFDYDNLGSAEGQLNIHHQQQQVNEDEPALTFHQLLSNDLDLATVPAPQQQGQEEDEPMMHQSQQGLEDEPVFPYDNLMLDIDLLLGIPETLSCLERTCERKSIEEATRAVENPSFQDKEKSTFMCLGNAMVKGLFDKIGLNEEENSSNFFDDFTMLYRVNDELVGGAVTSFVVSQSPDFVLEILGNVKIRHEWDYLAGMRKLNPIVCYPTGKDTRNTVSLSKIDDEDIMLIQEVTIDRSRSQVVWSTLPRDASYRISLGQEADFPLLVSGFVICQNGHGSVVTLVLRMFSDVDEPPLTALTALKETVKRVKEALEKRQQLSPPTGALTQDEPVIGSCSSDKQIYLGEI